MPKDRDNVAADFVIRSNLYNNLRGKNVFLLKILNKMKPRIAAILLAIFLMGTASQSCGVFKEKCNECPKFDSSKKKKRKNL